MTVIKHPVIGPAFNTLSPLIHNKKRFVEASSSIIHVALIKRHEDLHIMDYSPTIKKENWCKNVSFLHFIIKRCLHFTIRNELNKEITICDPTKNLFNLTLTMSFFSLLH